MLDFLQRYPAGGFPGNIIPNHTVSGQLPQRVPFASCAGGYLRASVAIKVFSAPSRLLLAYASDLPIELPRTTSVRGGFPLTANSPVSPGVSLCVFGQRLSVPSRSASGKPRSRFLAVPANVGRDQIRTGVLSGATGNALPLSYTPIGRPQGRPSVGCPTRLRLCRTVVL